MILSDSVELLHGALVELTHGVHTLSKFFGLDCGSRVRSSGVALSGVTMVSKYTFKRLSSSCTMSGFSADTSECSYGSVAKLNSMCPSWGFGGRPSRLQVKLLELCVPNEESAQKRGHNTHSDGWSPWSPQASYDRRRHRAGVFDTHIVQPSAVKLVL